MATKRTPKRPAKKLNVVAVRLDDDMKERLERIARAQRRPLANMINFALAEWLEMQEGDAQAR
jgi:predicted transcriptional regulator